MKKATVLLAHGSSDPHWLEPFDQLTHSIAQQLPAGTPLQLAYMELAEPMLEDAVIDLVKSGHQHIDILPLFFAAGRHLRKDVPEMLDAVKHKLQQQGFSCELDLHTPIGLEPEVASAISQVVIRQLS
ncbi:MAG: CbiX/SirB N-terminal domain-containing protein [Saccharospirillaceae bacterium]|nr:hypothetical protein A3759_07205 [Thalassolituus sp. HI0120]MCH2041680.1 CbiX/SirB N-terminal domain-containing protein [Saccharospirillaceae bacterium]